MSGKIYCISGLGADYRIFSNLRLSQNYKPVYLPWLQPQPTETIESYAMRLSALITDEEPVLLGVSFGGMLSIEISKIIKTRKTIIISSIKTRKEKPFYFKAAAAMRLNKLIPMHSNKLLEPLENRNLGVRTEEEKALSHEYRANYNGPFLDWAIDRIIHWHNEIQPHNLIHIHGTHDKIFPIKYVKPDYKINGGGHIMVLNKAEEISEIIRKVLPFGF